MTSGNRTVALEDYKAGCIGSNFVIDWLAAADHLVRSYHHTYGLPVLTTNCSNNYGSFHFPGQLIPLCILNAVHQDWVADVTSGGYRQWVDRQYPS